MYVRSVSVSLCITTANSYYIRSEVVVFKTFGHRLQRFNAHTEFITSAWRH